jgi:predicted Zn-dependent protease
MPNNHWTLDQLKNLLSRHPDVKAWIITREHVQRRERYFMQDSKILVIDQDRDVCTQSVSVKIVVTIPKSGRQGEITQKFFTSVPLNEQVERAVEAALQTDHQEWELPPELSGELQPVKTADSRMAEDLESVMSEMTTRIERAVAKNRVTGFNSAELFLSIHDREIHLSNGLVHRSSQSRIYAEAAYSMTRAGADGVTESDEYLNTRWGVSLADCPVEELFNETSERAERSLDVSKPRSGRYPVIVDSEVLLTLFNGHISQLSASNIYNGLPFVKSGDELIPGATGDLITLTLDPTIEFGGDTVAVSEQGVPQRPLKLVERNRVIASMADKQYADYMGLPVSTARGNVVVAAGSMSYAELTASAPKVIEILQFSGLCADSNSGTFSSEIRLARLFDNIAGTVHYLKGGSLSGSVLQNFKGARLSKNRVNRTHFSSGSMQGLGYFGPDFALLSDVSIVS